MTLLTLDQITLSDGAHDDAREGMCAMEAVSYLQGEPFSDHPKCVCPVIASFMRRWNDDLSDADRNRLLKPLLLKCVGTKSTEDVELRRSYLAIDWFIRTHAPAWIDLVESLKPHAAKLRALPPVTDVETLQSAGEAIFAARDARAAARAAARDAARAAARAAARDAASKKLQPTVFALQQSAIELFERLVACQ